MSTEEPELGWPTSAVRDSFVAAVAEFHADGSDAGALGDQEIPHVGDERASPEGFARLVAALRAEALKENPSPSRTRSADHAVVDTR